MVVQNQCTCFSMHVSVSVCVCVQFECKCVYACVLVCGIIVCVVSWCVCERECLYVLTSVLSVCELPIMVQVIVYLSVCNNIVLCIVSVCWRGVVIVQAGVSRMMLCGCQV